MHRLLVIDDNIDILRANQVYLAGEGFCVTVAETGDEALNAIGGKTFDCIVLDILLPDINGFTICKAARTVTDAPIMFLTCMDDTDDKVKGFMSGADDYMTKPYSLRELSVRIHALIRRRHMDRQVKKTDFYVDYDNKMIYTGEKSIFLSEKEFELFLLFYEHPQTVFSKEEIYNRIWRYSEADIGTIAVHVLKLRRKTKAVEKFIGRIENVYGTGYTMVTP